jgi:phosphoglycerol transferase MdoB-like AlkP superfamily enzyme
MTSASLFLVFVLAKLVILWGHAAPVTGWSLLAYVWQDVAVALVFGVFEITLNLFKIKFGRIGGRRIVWASYWAITIYTAINIPVGRAVSTPLTRPMLRAARGPLADSMHAYVTATNFLLVALLLAAAAGLPWVMGRVPRLGRIRLAISAVSCAIAIILLGPIASSRADTRGMDRNVLTALMGTGLPHVMAKGGATDWREALGPSEALGSREASGSQDWQFAADRAVDLSRFQGVAQGLNVVMISLESTAAQYLSLYGAQAQQDAMPNLTALAQKALVFENAYAAYPESIKGLFSVLCSTFPAFDSQPEEYANVDCRSVASVLGDAGYRTAMFHSGRFGYLGMESIIRNRGYQTLEDAGDIAGNHNSSFGVDEPATVARMLAWIDNLPRGQRFFLNYLPIAGHHPYATPDRGPFRGGAEIDQYRNALHYGDASLGALVEGLRARGLEQNTVWVIYGDHGEAFRQHEGNYGHTFFLYEENVHVPFVIAAPGLMSTQQRVHQVVSLVDIAPTILDLMGVTGVPGIAPPKNYQGRSMLEDARDRAPEMALFFTDYSLGLLGLRDGRWKFIYETGSGRVRLFDLERDPRETLDVSAREMALTPRYSRVVSAWISAQKSYIARAAMR